MGLQVSGVLIYPLEGAGAWRVPDNTPWPVEESGLRWNRTWCLVDLDTQEVLTRETAPRLLLLSSEVDVEGGVLHVTPHKSLHSTKSGNTHLCLPLEDVAGAMQRAACVHCAAGDLQMAAQTARRGTASVSATVCTSEHIVAFFSTALGRRCTVARVEKPTSQETLGAHHLVKPSNIIVVEEAPPSSPLVQGSETSGTLISSSQSGTERSAASPEPDSHRPLEEALAESMQANIILAQRPEATNLIREENWLFLAMGSRCTDVRHPPAPLFLDMRLTLW